MHRRKKWLPENNRPNPGSMTNEKLISVFQGLISLSSPVSFVRTELRVHQGCRGFLVPTNISRERIVYLRPYQRQQWLMAGGEE